MHASHPSADVLSEVKPQRGYDMVRVRVPNLVSGRARGQGTWVSEPVLPVWSGGFCRAFCPTEDSWQVSSRKVRSHPPLLPRSHAYCLIHLLIKTE